MSGERGHLRDLGEGPWVGAGLDPPQAQHRLLGVRFLPSPRLDLLEGILPLPVSQGRCGGCLADCRGEEHRLRAVWM